MFYQRLNVATGDPIGAPGDLPRELRGLAGDVLADLTGVLSLGGRWDGVGFVRYAPRPPAPEPQIRWLHKSILIQRLTAEEVTAIRVAGQSDPVIAYFLYVLEQSELVDLDAANLVAGLGYLVAQQLLTEERAAALRTDP